MGMNRGDTGRPWSRAGRLLLGVSILVAACGGDPAVDAAPDDPVDAIVSALQAQAPGLHVERSVASRLGQGGRSDVLLYFGERPDLSAAWGMDWKSRGRYVHQRLREAAERSQGPARALLDQRGIAYEAFWIDNVVAVTGSDLGTLQALASLPQLTAVRSPRRMGLIEPLERRPATSIGMEAIESNLEHVGVPAVWEQGIRGSGIVVANIDTGVRHTHVTLQNQYRGRQADGSDRHDYNWWDPYGRSDSPSDVHGHGSHTMGTMIGDDASHDNRIGVAPAARWIACRGCDETECGSTQLLECAQFMAAPWDRAKANANPDLRPHVVNNSWGDCGASYDGWYQGVVDAWHAAGIYPVFSNGNASNCGYAEPPGCNTVGNPGRYGNVTGVGSTGRSDGRYAPHSNWGSTDNADGVNPRGFATLKPQVMAPGVDIRSALAGSDTEFEAWSGTSMSAPHVSGLIALIWQAAPCLVGQYALTETVLEESAVPIPYASGCGGEGPGNVPNMATGWGEIDAPAAVASARTWCGPSGTIEGVVTTPDGGAIQGALVTVGKRSAISGAGGAFRLTYVPVGTHTIAASHYWHYDTSAEVAVAENAITVQDLVMVPKPRVAVRGTVRDGEEHGWPLYARIVVQVPDQEPVTVYTNPFDGAYQVELVADATFPCTVESIVPGYETLVQTLSVDAGPCRRDFILEVRDCAAPGYARQLLYSEDFEASDGGFEAGGVTSWARGRPSLGPGAAHSGTAAWATDLSGTYGNGENGTLTSPVIDLSAVAGAGVRLSWWQHLMSEQGFDKAQVEVSRDGGASWAVAYGPASGGVDPVWARRFVDLGPSYAVPGFRFRFGFQSDDSFAQSGWYIDDVALERTDCAAAPGGLVAGFVTDGGTDDPLAGATLSADQGGTAVSFDTPDDPAVADGLYVLFAEGGGRTITAARLGYSDASRQATVAPDDVTRVDFALGASAVATVRGTVRDGAGHDWPLYARIRVTPPDGGDTATVFSDPFTGAYEVRQFEGYPYRYQVESVVPGYASLEEVVTASGSPYPKDFRLSSPRCEAPGYGRPVRFAAGFEGTDGGFTVVGNSSWAWGSPTSGPGGAHSGAGAWATGLAGEYGNGEDGALTSPVLDLTAAGGSPVRLSWWQYLVTEYSYDTARVEVSKDGGSTWSLVLGPDSGEVDGAWAKRTVELDASCAVPGFRFRFRFSSDSTAVFAGWYVDDVALDGGDCERLPGGLVSGVVTDASSGAGLVDAGIEVSGGHSTRSLSTPDDPAVPDGLYVVFAEAGTRTLVASQRFFAESQAMVAVTADDVTRQDFALGSSRLDASPERIEARLQTGQSAAVELVLQNSGTGAAPYRILETLGHGAGGNEPPRILAYIDDAIHRGPNTFLDLALVSLGYPYTAYYDGDFEGFREDLNGASWDLVLFEDESLDGSGVFGDLAAYVTAGGRLVFSSWMADAPGARPLLDALEFSPEANDLPPADALYWWDAGHPIFTSPNDVPGFSQPVEVGLGICGQHGTPLGMAQALAGRSGTPQAGQAVLVLGNQGRTVFRGFFDAPGGSDLDGDTVPDSQELWVNLVQYLLASGPADLPWISETPDQGTVLPGESREVEVVFSAQGMEPGTYRGMLVIHAEDSPYPDRLVSATLEIGHVITVTPPENGTVTPGGESFVRHGDDAVFTFEPADGYHVRDVIVDGVSKGRRAGYVFVAVAGNHTLEVRFQQVCEIDADCTDFANDCLGTCVDGACDFAALKPRGAACGDGAQAPCSDPDTCDGAGACRTNRLEAGTWCRPAAGPCDVAEACDGESDTCPADGKSTKECRAVAGPCDLAEACDGVDDACPADGKSTVECRPAAGPCDVAEACDGVNDACPADGKSIAECRAAAGVCDAVEFCDGAGVDCPADGKSTAVCRAAGGPCDVPEACDGVGDECPADGRALAGAACDDGEACTREDRCDGLGPACGGVRYHCVAGACESSSECNGTGGCRVTPKAVGATCDDGDACTGGDRCEAEGRCIGAPLACDRPPRPACQDGSTSVQWEVAGACDPETGGCEHAFVATSCAGGCIADTGLCQGDTGPDCTAEPASPCRERDGWRVVDASTGVSTCFHPRMAEGAACDDGDPCTLEDRCDAVGECRGEAAPQCLPEAVEGAVDEAGGTDIPEADAPGDTAGDQEEALADLEEAVADLEEAIGQPEEAIGGPEERPGSEADEADVPAQDVGVEGTRDATVPVADAGAEGARGGGCTAAATGSAAWPVVMLAIGMAMAVLARPRRRRAS